MYSLCTVPIQKYGEYNSELILKSPAAQVGRLCQTGPESTTKMSIEKSLTSYQCLISLEWQFFSAIPSAIWLTSFHHEPSECSHWLSIGEAESLHRLRKLAWLNWKSEMQCDSFSVYADMISLMGSDTWAINVTVPPIKSLHAKNDRFLCNWHM